MNWHIAWPVLAALALTNLLALPATGLAQAPTAESRESVLEKVKEAARRHVANSETVFQSDRVLTMYSSNTAGVTAAEIVETYETEFMRGKKSRELGIWDRLLAQAGWGISILLGLVLISLAFWRSRRAEAPVMRNGNLTGVYPGRSVDRGLVATGKQAKPTARRLLGGSGIGRYRSELIHSLESMSLPFAPSNPWRMLDLFVPPRIREAKGDEVDFFAVLSRSRRVLLKGLPGSGKSALLKHTALMAAANGIPGLANKLVPILIDLTRIKPLKSSTPDAKREPKAAGLPPLEQALLEELRSKGFTNSLRFLMQRLRQGGLLLLFDGLDEVSALRRAEVTQQLRDLLANYDDCRVVIATRANGAKEDLARSVDATVELDEFGDQQIRRYLGQWKRTLSPEHPFTTDQFLKTLRESEQGLLWARNPLLLSLLTYCFTERPQGFPETRALLYRQALEFVMGKYHPEPSRYPRETKLEVLSHVALALAESATRDGNGVESQAAVLQEIRAILGDPKRSFPQGTDSAELLEELTNRDGFLLADESSSPFRHRSWREFLAAAALGADGSVALSTRAKQDPGAWIETARFWSGLDNDATSLLEGWSKEDPIAGNGCLPDARKVSPETLTKIVGTLKDKLGTGDGVDGQARALAALAVPTRAGGAELFNFLVQELKTSKNAARKQACARALALTQSSAAATELGAVYGLGVEYRKALARLGEIAIPELVRLAKTGSADAFDDLLAIGTPAAAEAMTPMLWDSDQELANRAAWRLAALVQSPSVETALDQFSLAQIKAKPGAYDWIWEPFVKGETSAMPLIAGQIATLLERAPVEAAPKSARSLDPRLVIPLCSVIKKQEAWRLTEEPPEKLRQTLVHALEKATGKRYNARLSALDDGAPSSAELADARSRFVGLVLHVGQASRSWQYLVDGLKPEARFELLYGLFRGPTARRRDWLEIRQPAPKAFSANWVVRTLLVLTALLSLCGLAVLGLLAFNPPRPPASAIAAQTADDALTMPTLPEEDLAPDEEKLPEDKKGEEEKQPEDPEMITTEEKAETTSTAAVQAVPPIVVLPASTRMQSKPWMLAVAAAAIVWFWLFLSLQKNKRETLFRCFWLGPLTLLATPFLLLQQILAKITPKVGAYSSSKLAKIVSNGVGSLGSAAIIYFASMYLLNYWDWARVLSLWLGIGLVAAILWAMARARERDNANPLRGCGKLLFSSARA